MRLRHPALILAAALALAGVGARAQGDNATAPAAAPESTAATYVGSETCAGCHDEVATALGKTPHGSQLFGKLGVHGCETCHGPGSKHVEDPTVEANQPRIDNKPAAAQTAICRTCHDGGEQFLWDGSRHAQRGLACESCHSVHSFKSPKAQLKAASAAEQCFACHQTVRAETWKTSHHPIREGKISCADCHNPHGSEAPKMVRAASVNDLCYQCHTEKRGPFLWEHPPVRENCMNCHTPHGSNHLKLQKTSVPYLCQQCHSNTRHPGTLYDATTLADQSRASNRIFNRACLDCHAAVHGSNHPSSPYLGH